MPPVNVFCVNHNDYLGRGAEYVSRLADGVKRHATVPHRFIVLTEKDVPDFLEGWWAKLWMFKSGILPKGERCVYFDLDTVIRGNIDWLLTHDGPFAALTDFYHPRSINSSVMAWSAGSMGDVWSVWLTAGKPELKIGDQHWIWMMRPDAARLQDIYPGEVVSYKKDCQQRVPPKASVICFHGLPRPHEVNWLEEKVIDG